MMLTAKMMMLLFGSVAGMRRDPFVAKESKDAGLDNAELKFDVGDKVRGVNCYCDWVGFIMPTNPEVLKKGFYTLIRRNVKRKAGKLLEKWETYQVLTEKIVLIEKKASYSHGFGKDRPLEKFDRVKVHSLESPLAVWNGHIGKVWLHVGSEDLVVDGCYRIELELEKGTSIKSLPFGRKNLSKILSGKMPGDPVHTFSTATMRSASTISILEQVNAKCIERTERRRQRMKVCCMKLSSKSIFRELRGSDQKTRN